MVGLESDSYPKNRLWFTNLHLHHKAVCARRELYAEALEDFGLGVFAAGLLKCFKLEFNVSWLFNVEMQTVALALYMGVIALYSYGQPANEGFL